VTYIKKQYLVVRATTYC